MQLSNLERTFAKNLFILPMMKSTKSTEIAQLGEFGLIERLTSRLGKRNETTLVASGDDAAVIEIGDEVLLMTTDMMRNINVVVITMEKMVSMVSVRLSTTEESR